MRRRRSIPRARQTGATVEVGLALIFVAIAVLMASIAIGTAILATRAAAERVQAKGVVIDLVERVDGEGNTLYYPVVDFPLPEDSRRRVETTDGSWPPAYQVDDTVTVTYHPADPGRVQIDSPSATVLNWIWPLVTGILCVAFLLAAWLARWLAGATANLPPTTPPL